MPISPSTLVLISLSVFAVLVLLLGGFAMWAFLFYRSSKVSLPEKDPAMMLLQQELTALRGQLDQSLTRVGDLTTQQLGQIQQQMNHATQNIQETTGQISSRIDHYNQVVQNVSHQLGSLSQATERIFEATKNIASLEEILKPPKLRGTMGEILLENVLREILPSQELYKLQYLFKNGTKVDAVILLREGLIPIDAKFPLDNFRKMIETREEKERQTLRKEFIRNLKKHIDEISEKYLLPDEGTLNFALMYVPAENVYYEMVIRNEDTEDLYSYATQRHVFPVSPNSLYPYLMTLALGFRGLKIELQAKEILGQLSRLQGDLEKFGKDFAMIGDHLGNAQKKFGEAERKFNRLEIKVDSMSEGTALPAPPEEGNGSQ